MTTRIYFRLPNDSLVHHLSSSQPATPIRSMSQIDNTPGYLLAPFTSNDHDPILLITPEVEKSFPLPSISQFGPLLFQHNEEESLSNYKASFAQCLEHLKKPSLKKIVLARTLHLQLEDALTNQQLEILFFSAAHQYPQAYVTLIQSPEVGTWLVATPELLLEEREEKLHTMALAATLPIQEGAKLTPEQWSDKNREEQRLVADYIEDRLNRLQVSYQRSPLHTHNAGKLSHLCTKFTITPPVPTLGLVLATLHPTPAVCGVPAEEAARLLAEIEKEPRHYYAGFSGPIGLNAGTHLYVTLRCFHLSGNDVTLYAGAGLLADSEFQTEWEETRYKMQTMLTLLQ